MHQTRRFAIALATAVVVACGTLDMGPSVVDRRRPR